MMMGIGIKGIVFGHGFFSGSFSLQEQDGWPTLLILRRFPFRNDGCPVLAFCARAGTTLPIVWVPTDSIDSFETNHSALAAPARRCLLAARIVSWKAKPRTPITYLLLFPRNPNPLFHLIQIFGERPPSACGQAIFRARYAAFEKFHARNVFGFFQFARVDA